MISSSLVKELRHMTSAPLMECKKALEETNGNLEEAKNFLRKKGQLLASKKSSREANEGVVAIHFDEAIKKAGMVKLSCETDFVARNDQFQETTEKLAKLASEGADSFEEKQLEGTQVKDYLTEIIAEIRENIVLSQVMHWHWSDTAVVNFYVHHNKKIGVLVELEVENPNAEGMMEIAKDICLHIAANKVEFISGEEVSDEILEKEKNFLMGQAKESGKPPEIMEKMIVGKLQKFKKEICLLDQPFLKNPDISVAKLLVEKTNQLGQKIAVKRFCKFTF